MPVGYATTHKALGGQDHLLFEIDTDARHRHWLVCQPLCLWTGSVKGIISTFETLPNDAAREGKAGQTHRVAPVSTFGSVIERLGSGREHEQDHSDAAAPPLQCACHTHEDSAVGNAYWP